MIRLMRWIKDYWILIFVIALLVWLNISVWKQLEHNYQIRRKIDSLSKRVDGLEKSVGKLNGKPSVSKTEKTGSIPVRRANTQGSLVYWKTVRAKVTAYEPSRISCGKFANGRTSTNTNAWRTTGVATDPRAIPYGTVVDIPGIGKRVVDDCGSAMRRSWNRGIYHIDVRKTYVWQCRQWGTKILMVKLYRKKI